MTRIQHQRRQRRQGFTLVELLVVVAVVMLLLTMTFAAMSSALGIARQRATQATILKVHGLMQQRVEAFNRALDQMNLQPVINNLMRDIGISSSTTFKAYEILAKKQIFQNRFPQNFYESYLPATTTSYNAALHNQNTESAALLYWILTQSEIYGVAPVDQSDFSTSEVRDTDGDGLLEFVDGWGHPLRYYRWPTHLFRPGNATTAPGVVGPALPITLTSIDRTYVSVIWQGLPAPPASAGDLDPLARDPDDPTGELRRFVLNSAAPAAVLTFLENRFHTPDTYNAFLIVSAGPDNSLGLGEPCDYGTTTSPPSVPDGYIAGTPGTYTFFSTAPALGMLTVPPGGSTAPPQGRLASLLGYGPIQENPINDNLTNRKR